MSNTLPQIDDTDTEDDTVVQDGPKIKLQTLVDFYTFYVSQGSVATVWWYVSLQILHRMQQ